MENMVNRRGVIHEWRAKAEIMDSIINNVVTILKLLTLDFLGMSLTLTFCLTLLLITLVFLSILF